MPIQHIEAPRVQSKSGAKALETHTQATFKVDRIGSLPLFPHVTPFARTPVTAYTGNEKAGTLSNAGFLIGGANRDRTGPPPVDDLVIGSRSG